MDSPEIENPILWTYSFKWAFQSRSVSRQELILLSIKNIEGVDRRQIELGAKLILADNFICESNLRWLLQKYLYNLFGKKGTPAISAQASHLIGIQVRHLGTENIRLQQIGLCKQC